MISIFKTSCKLSNEADGSDLQKLIPERMNYVSPLKVARPPAPQGPCAYGNQGCGSSIGGRPGH